MYTRIFGPGGLLGSTCGKVLFKKKTIGEEGDGELEPGM